MEGASIGSALTALAQLSQLTSLTLIGSWATVERSDRGPNCVLMAEPAAGALQQLLVQPLPLQELNLSLYFGCHLPVLDMSRLAKLSQLDTDHCVLPDESVLPATLQQLKLYSWSSCDSSAPVTRLLMKQLQYITMFVTSPQLQPLLQLAQLPALQHLSLVYHRDRPWAGLAAAATASAWPLLPQLRALTIEDAHLTDKHELARVLAGVAAATSLTQLYLTISFTCPEPTVIDPCSSLTGLTRLKELSCAFPWPRSWIWPRDSDNANVTIAPGDALALTALTGLTRLELFRAGHGVGTTAATAIASNTKQLQKLLLVECGLELGGDDGMACLEALGRLTQLTLLGLARNKGLTQQGLMQLTLCCPGRTVTFTTFAL